MQIGLYSGLRWKTNIRHSHISQSTCISLQRLTYCSEKMALGLSDSVMDHVLEGQHSVLKCQTKNISESIADWIIESLPCTL